MTISKTRLMKLVEADVIGAWDATVDVLSDDDLLTAETRFIHLATLCRETRLRRLTTGRSPEHGR